MAGAHGVAGHVVSDVGHVVGDVGHVAGDVGHVVRCGVQVRGVGAGAGAWCGHMVRGVW
jgi:hypothetical protein